MTGSVSLLDPGVLLSSRLTGLRPCTAPHRLPSDGSWASGSISYGSWAELSPDTRCSFSMPGFRSTCSRYGSSGSFSWTTRTSSAPTPEPTWIANSGRSVEICLALRWERLDAPPGNPTFHALNTARAWMSFRDALRSYSFPPTDFTYADVDGNVGAQSAGWVPIRAAGDGAVPVPGSSGAFEWTGYVPFDELPSTYAPAEGFVVRANQNHDAGACGRFLSRRWHPPYRARRIRNLVRAAEGHTVESFAEIQFDLEWIRKERIRRPGRPITSRSRGGFSARSRRRLSAPARNPSLVRLGAFAPFRPRFHRRPYGPPWPLRYPARSPPAHSPRNRNRHRRHPPKSRKPARRRNRDPLRDEG